MSQHFRKTILIVCEGARTEPNYFKEFRDIIISKDPDIYIKLDPIPKHDKDKEEIEKKAQRREGGRARILKNTAIQFPDLMVEDKYLSQPTYYVRKAQLGLVDSVYDEVWAVYDKDGHASHQEAVELAQITINNKNVNIAFNSISFEYWILLHFESNLTIFQKSMCRTNLPDDKKEYHFCGKNIHNLDCQGRNCVCGRIVGQGYLAYEMPKKEFLFSQYFPNVNEAIERAVKLKNSYRGNASPVYDLNPYTTTHRIVFKLLHLPDVDYTWFEFGQLQRIGSFTFSFEIENSILKIEVINSGHERQFLNVQDICFVDSSGSIQAYGQRYLIDENFSFQIDLNSIQGFDAIFIAIRKSEKQYLITELPF
ncbi:RloB family protein [Flavobacterium johnsoniae]|uniref:RloB family protein n=1 Tax=Flavobacterium johnsoniae TaxID=986 RepID=UPI003D962815